MNVIVKRRKDLEYTQEKLAELSGVPLRTIQKYERGENIIENMTLKTASALANALAIKIDYLYVHRDGVQVTGESDRARLFARLYLIVEKMADEQGRSRKFSEIAGERPYSQYPKTQFVRLHEAFSGTASDNLKDKIGEVFNLMDDADFSDKPLSDEWAFFKYTEYKFI